MSITTSASARVDADLLCRACGGTSIVRLGTNDLGGARGAGEVIRLLPGASRRSAGAGDIERS
jgi:hypothetical protein